MNTTQSFTSRLVLLLGAAAIILTGSLLVAGVGAHADTASSTPPVISNVITTPTDIGATITWTTDQAANTQVNYGPTILYNASSTLNAATSTSHTSFLGGLLPNTLYHFQLVSSNASGTIATSSDMTFTTMLASSTATSTASTSLPVISTVLATPTSDGATVTWNTDVGSNSQVSYGTTTDYGFLSTLNSSSVLSHLVTLMGLVPSTLYHFKVWSATTSATGVASSSDYTFTTIAGSTTATTTPPTTGSTTLEMLQAQIDALKARVTALENFIAGLGGGGTGTTTPPVNPGGGTGTIDQNNMSINAGGSIDLSGRNFGHEENVVVTLNGATVATAHADGGGNFSTGSIAAPTVAGTYVYHFTGQTSGVTGTATITVH